MNRDQSIYSISEMAEIHGISRQTLLYYDRIGLFRPAWTEAANGYRRYTLEQCPLLREIRLLVKLNVPLAEIRDYLQGKDLPRIKALLEEQKEKTRRRLEELKEIDKIMDLRLANLKEVQSMTISDEAGQSDAGQPSARRRSAPLTFRTYPRRYFSRLPYPGTPSTEESSLLFRRIIGRYRRFLRGGLFRQLYDELKFKHCQLILPPPGSDAPGCAAVYADAAVFRLMRGEMDQKTTKKMEEEMDCWEGGRFARSLYRGPLEEAPRAAAALASEVMIQGLHPRGDTLFTAILEPPFILNPTRQVYAVEVRVDTR